MDRQTTKTNMTVIPACDAMSSEKGPPFGKHLCGSPQHNPPRHYVGSGQAPRIRELKHKWERLQEAGGATPFDPRAIHVAKRTAREIFDSTQGKVDSRKDHFLSTDDLENHMIERLLKQPKLLERFTSGELTDKGLRTHFLKYGHELVTKYRKQRMPGSIDSPGTGVVDNSLGMGHIRAFLSYGIFDPVAWEALGELAWSPVEDQDMALLCVMVPQDFTVWRVQEFQKVYDSLRDSYQQMIFRQFALGEQLSTTDKKVLDRALLDMSARLNGRSVASIRHSATKRHARNRVREGSSAFTDENKPHPVEKEFDDELSLYRKDAPRTWQRPTRDDIEWIREIRRANDKARQEAKLETLTCEECGGGFQREVQKGRKPKFCPPCDSGRKAKAS